MKVSTLLALVLFLLMAVIGKKKGFKSFAALFFNYMVIAVSIILIAWHVNVAFLIVVNFVSILLINLFFINQRNVKTVCALIATSLTLLIMIGLIYFIVKYAMIEGFGEEEQDAISGFTLNVGISFMKVSIYVIAISSISAIIDVSLSVASALYELYQLNPQVKVKHLLNSGLKIGRDILGTTTNTLYFSLIGGYLTLMIWFKTLSYSFAEILNSKVFAAEILSILSGAIGVVLVIPATAILSSYILVNYRSKK